MKSLPFLGAFVAFSCVACVVGGCGGGMGTSTSPVTSSKGISAEDTTLLPTPDSSPSANEPVSATGRYQNLIFTLSADKKVYTDGEFVPLILSVQNTGDIDASSIIYYNPADGEVTTQSGKMISPLIDEPFTTGQLRVPHPIVYPAGQTVSFPLLWRQQKKVGDRADGQAVPGTYRIRAFIAVDNLDGAAVPTHALGTDYLEVIVQ